MYSMLLRLLHPPQYVDYNQHVQKYAVGISPRRHEQYEQLQWINHLLLFLLPASALVGFLCRENCRAAHAFVRVPTIERSTCIRDQRWPEGFDHCRFWSECMDCRRCHERKNGEDDQGESTESADHVRFDKKWNKLKMITFNWKRQLLGRTASSWLRSAWLLCGRNLYCLTYQPVNMVAAW